jgi:protein TonB
MKTILRPQIEKIPEDSSEKSVLQVSEMPDNRLGEVSVPAADLKGHTDSIGSGNKAAVLSAGNASGYSSPAAVSSVSAMQGSGSGGDGQHGPGPSESYRQAIYNAIQRNLVYPYIARKRRMEGTALIEFKINQKGVPENVFIIRSSGHTILDAAAKETVIKASPFPAAGKTIEIPITFLLKDNR